MKFRVTRNTDYTANSFGDEIGPPPDADDLETYYDGTSGIQIFVESGNMTCRIGAGIDFQLNKTGYYPTLTEGYGGYLFDVSGTTGRADFEGGTYGDIMKGGLAGDMLSGKRGRDSLYGGAGADTIEGGLDKDRLHGGRGADNFVFGVTDSSAKKSAADIIYDFTRNDTLDLSGIDANEDVFGDQAFTFIGSRNFHDRAGELRAVTQRSDTWIMGDTDGDGKADFTIRLDDAVAMKAGYFDL